MSLRFQPQKSLAKAEDLRFLAASATMAKCNLYGGREEELL